MKITIFGAGNMARAIGMRALAGGHAVRITARNAEHSSALIEDLRSSRNDADVDRADPVHASQADIVVLAVPFEAAKELAGDLHDTIAVEISNPVDFGTFDSLTVAPGSSAAEEVARVAGPGVHVVKAFNTVFASTLTDGEVAGMPLDVFVAGDDPDAKAAVSELIAGGGQDPIDAGPLRRARELEGFQFLHMTLQERLGLHWRSAMKLLR